MNVHVWPAVSSSEVGSSLQLLVEKLNLQSPDTSLTDQMKVTTLTNSLKLDRRLIAVAQVDDLPVSCCISQ